MNLPTTVSLETRTTKVRYVVLAWACSLSMLTYVDRVCIKQVEQDMSTALALSPQQFAWVFSAFGLAYALFEVPSGFLGDRYGPRRVLCRIVIWWSFFTALTGLVWQFSFDSGYILSMPWGAVPLVFNSLVLLVIIRFMFGAGEAGAYPNIARALRNWFPYQRRGMAQGLLWMFGRWGGAMAPGLILVASIPFGWRGAFVAFGVLGVLWVAAFAIWFKDKPEQHAGVNPDELAYIREGKPEQTEPPPLSWRSMLSSPTLWCLSLMYFCSNCGWVFFITWDRRYYEHVLGMSGTSLAIISGAPLFFGGLACLFGGLGTDRMVKILGGRWGRTLQGFLAYALGGLFFLLALLTSNPWLAVPALCIASFVKDFAMAASWSTCIDIGHRYSGTVAGFMNMVGNLGTFFSPPIVAWLASPSEPGGATRWDLALLYSAVMFLIAALGWVFINPRRVIVYSKDDHAKLVHDGVIR